MEFKDFQDELVKLKNDLKGANSNEIKAGLDDIQAKVNKTLEEYAEKGVKTSDLENMEVKMNDGIKALQDHLDKLDVKLQGKSQELPKGAIPFEHGMQNFITKNFDAIKNVSKGKGLKFDNENLELKAVGDMTTANITGDLFRTYSSTVAAIPDRLVHFVDLCGADINIGNGVYTFPREGAGEGGAAKQTEGSAKSQIDTDMTHVDVATDFIAGFARYSKKMRNNVNYLESFLPRKLRREYLKAEDSVFNTALAAAATASSQIITGKNTVEMLINELATLEESDIMANVMVCRPSDWWNIFKGTRPSTGVDYSWPGVVTFDNGVIRINGIPLLKSTFMTANKYYVGDFTEINRVVTEGLSIEFSESDADNFTKNNITARIEAQVGLAIHLPSNVIYGDFTAV